MHPGKGGVSDHHGMNREFISRLEMNPVIAAVKDDKGLDLCLTSDVEVVFLLYGDIVRIPELVEKVKAHGKAAMVHLDLIAGLSAKDIAADFIHCRTSADGIITTKANLVPHAKELGMATVLRYFLLDSMAMSNVERQKQLPYHMQPDVIEILPGIVSSRVMKKVCSSSHVPVIAGGLIKDREDVMNALKSGCAAISSTSPDVWFL